MPSGNGEHDDQECYGQGGFGPATVLHPRGFGLGLRILEFGI